MARDEKITRSPFDERHLGMLVLGDAGERCARLALAAGAERHDLVGRQVAVGVDIAVKSAARLRDSRSRGRPATTRSMARPTTTTSRPACAGGSRRRRLNAGDVGREGGHRDAGGAPPRTSSAEGAARRRPRRAIGRRARHWWNRRPAREQPRRRRALAQLGLVGRRAEHGRRIELPVRRYAARCRAVCAGSARWTPGSNGRRTRARCRTARP